MYQREPVFSAIFDALALKHTKFNINWSKVGYYTHRLFNLELLTKFLLSNLTGWGNFNPLSFLNVLREKYSITVFLQQIYVQATFCFTFQFGLNPWMG
jgi:hypothetical protein